MKVVWPDRKQQTLKNITSLDQKLIIKYAPDSAIKQELKIPDLTVFDEVFPNQIFI
ncbi:MAG: hypothetical protein IPP49_11830 [Saprospiraceae bacterium]|nr:hypothetical protein [Saprospiraceae bacterium]